ncbi:hypothetical protein DENSPDRAFT_887156 [Dentipellis sp. KUC8613]|nr:hypothetical protein DENSPDRAFT_887156 [Dentipellis sp. KUC8613]
MRRYRMPRAAAVPCTCSSITRPVTFPLRLVASPSPRAPCHCRYLRSHPCPSRWAAIVSGVPCATVTPLAAIACLAPPPLYASRRRYVPHAVGTRHAPRTVIAARHASHHAPSRIAPPSLIPTQHRRLTGCNTI